MDVQTVIKTLDLLVLELVFLPQMNVSRLVGTELKLLTKNAIK